MWDVIIVGARCAGATTALRFARAGHSVLMLDKAGPSSDTLSTHVLAPSAMLHLEHLGLLDAVRATGAPPIHIFLVEFDGKAFPRAVQGPPDELLSVRRTTLDPLLVRAAKQAGVIIRHHTRVEQLVWENERVVGVQTRDQSGSKRIERAQLVVGADGRHSIVARQAQAPEYNALVCQSGACYAYFRGIGPSLAGADVLQFASGPACEVLCCPCDGDLHVVLLIVSAEEFVEIKRRGAVAFEARLRAIPAFVPRLAAAQRVSRLYPASPREMRGYFRQPFGSGWALVGDAGYYAHPAAANGIADALRSGELMQPLVTRAWAANQPAETYLEEYQHSRDTENNEEFHLSYRLGQVNPFADPEIAALFTGDG
jgi:2-polyprenyl-6-methoxyphenol hydroxylase-like FAD-dependent oxidoreductase